MIGSILFFSSLELCNLNIYHCLSNFRWLFQWHWLLLEFSLLPLEIFPLTFMGIAWPSFPFFSRWYADISLFSILQWSNGYCNCAWFAHSAAYSYMQTMYLVLVEKSGAEDGLSSVEIMFYNSFLSLPFLMFLIIATGEFPNSLSVLFAKVRILTWFLVLELIHDYATMSWIFRHVKSGLSIYTIK